MLVPTAALLAWSIEARSPGAPRLLRAAQSHARSGAHALTGYTAELLLPYFSAWQAALLFARSCSLLERGKPHFFRRGPSAGSNLNIVLPPTGATACSEGRALCSNFLRMSLDRCFVRCVPLPASRLPEGYQSAGSDDMMSEQSTLATGGPPLPLR